MFIAWALFVIKSLSQWIVLSKRLFCQRTRVILEIDCFSWSKRWIITRCRSDANMLLYRTSLFVIKLYSMHLTFKVVLCWYLQLLLSAWYSFWPGHYFLFCVCYISLLVMILGLGHLSQQLLKCYSIFGRKCVL